MLYKPASSMLPLLLISFSAFGQAAQGPASAVAGTWKADAKFQSDISSGSSEDFFWVGMTWGQILPTGRMSFYSDIGCVFSGLLAPSYQRLVGTVQMTHCPSPAMNRRYEVTVSGNTDSLVIHLRAVVPTSQRGRVDAFDVDGQFARYIP